jgi:peroxiredoxin
MITLVSEDGNATAVAATVVGDVVRVSPDVLRQTFGWELKLQGLCSGDVCIPVHGREAVFGPTGIDLKAFADLLGRPFVVDADAGVAHMGESARERGAQLASLKAPDFTLADLNGRLHSLSDYRGKRVLLVAHASWCGCRYDLPVWQSLFEQNKDRDFVVITVALDRNAEDARPWIEAAAATHPSLIDTEHLVAHRYSMINIPTMVWIDEAGQIVRPNDVAVTNDMFKDLIGVESGPRMAALRAWASDGTVPEADPDAVRAQLMAPTADEQQARAEFVVGWYLLKNGNQAAAERHFKKAGELSPFDWTIRRAAMPMFGIDPMQSMEMADLMSEWMAGGRPYYRPRPPAEH